MSRSVAGLLAILAACGEDPIDTSACASLPGYVGAVRFADATTCAPLQGTFSATTITMSAALSGEAQGYTTIGLALTYPGGATMFRARLTIGAQQAGTSCVGEGTIEVSAFLDMGSRATLTGTFAGSIETDCAAMPHAIDIAGVLDDVMLSRN